MVLEHDPPVPWSASPNAVQFWRQSGCSSGGSPAPAPGGAGTHLRQIRSGPLDSPRPDADGHCRRNWPNCGTASLSIRIWPCRKSKKAYGRPSESCRVDPTPITSASIPRVHFARLKTVMAATTWRSRFSAQYAVGHRTRSGPHGYPRRPARRLGPNGKQLQTSVVAEFAKYLPRRTRSHARAANAWFPVRRNFTDSALLIVPEIFKDCVPRDGHGAHGGT